MNLERNILTNITNQLQEHVDWLHVEDTEQ